MFRLPNKRPLVPALLFKIGTNWSESFLNLSSILYNGCFNLLRLRKSSEVVGTWDDPKIIARSLGSIPIFLREASASFASARYLLTSNPNIFYW